MIVATRKTGNLTTKVFRAQTYFQLAQMGMPLEEYHELIRSAANAFSQNFGSKDPYFAGYVRLKDILSAIYLTGVDPVEYASPIESVVKNVAEVDKISDPYELMIKLLNYKNTKLISRAPADTFGLRHVRKIAQEIARQID